MNFMPQCAKCISWSFLVLLACQVSPSYADCYLHNPPGSNNRNREESSTRQNANRLFDSQNNNQGGYAWRGDPVKKGAADELSYFPDSILRVEWTIQHGCGSENNVECDVILQYACEDSLPDVRDGYPTGDPVPRGGDGYLKGSFVSSDQATTGTSQIPMPRIPGSSGQRFPENDPDLDPDRANFTANVAAFYKGEKIGSYVGYEFGMHESYEQYVSGCLRTERNHGLYTADKSLGGKTARFTRQNSGGTRRGFECPEERDYYPYWNPTPWRDIAIMTSDVNRCRYYQDESQNTRSKWKCVLPASAAEDAISPISETACLTIDGVWTEVKPWNDEPPECQLHPGSRDNHLGNVFHDENGKPVTAFYDWKIPKLDEVKGKKCILRVRYNISATNYAPHEQAADPPRKMVDASLNCNPSETGAAGQAHCSASLEISGPAALYDNPDVQIFEGLPKISLAINTNQVGRTFQDRSHVFSIKDAKRDESCDHIWNLNVRGRRGNIVQAYPATEYDFVPSELSLTTADCVHVQIHNSDFSPSNGQGEGASGTDASNLVEISDRANNIPLSGERVRMFKEEDARALLMVGQDPDTCGVYENNNGADEQKPDNCAKLNARPNKYEHPNLLRFEPGSYTAISTRNNNFSNRSQKWRIHVVQSVMFQSVGAFLAIGVISTLVLSFSSMFIFARVYPHSEFARAMHRALPFTDPNRHTAHLALSEVHVSTNK